jgi:hypothetical protein
LIEHYLIPQVIAAVTATASADVGPTPFYIEIFDDSGALVKLCGSGATCGALYTPSASGSSLVAFVAPFSTTVVPRVRRPARRPRGPCWSRPAEAMGRIWRAGARRGTGEH